MKYELTPLAALLHALMNNRAWLPSIRLRTEAELDESGLETEPKRNKLSIDHWSSPVKMTSCLNSMTVTISQAHFAPSTNTQW